eukprot:scaffold3966_cov27-Prasinocladus_malaysianus.AAC.1
MSDLLRMHHLHNAYVCFEPCKPICREGLERLEYRYSPSRLSRRGPLLATGSLCWTVPGWRPTPYQPGSIHPPSKARSPQSVVGSGAVTAKKLAKQIRKEGNTVAGYTDEENPFGDTSLTEKFVWNKKLEKQIQEGRDVRELGAEAERLRQEQRL